MRAEGSERVDHRGRAAVATAAAAAVATAAAAAVATAAVTTATATAAATAAAAAASTPQQVIQPGELTRVGVGLAEVNAKLLEQRLQPQPGCTVPAELRGR